MFKKHHHNTAEHQTVEQLEHEYKLKAREGWDTAWNLLHSQTWKVETGTDLESGIIYSQHCHKLGKVFMLQGYVDASARETFEETVLKIDESPKWNPTVTECRTIHVVDENTDINYNITADAYGGIVSSRDFVTLRHWETRDGIILSCGIAVQFPDKPPLKKYVRGENKSGGWVFKPVPDNPNKCIFCWIVNTDIKGWIPHYVVDQTLAGMLFQFLRHLRQHILAVKSSADSGVQT